VGLLNYVRQRRQIALDGGPGAPRNRKPNAAPEVRRAPPRAILFAYELAIPFVIHIVDDDPQIRAATSYLLAGQGYKTEIYASAEELLAQPRLRDGCILFDWEMPGLGALEVLAELEARGCPTPVVMIGQEASVSSAIESLRRGAFDFLQKPYREGELIASIERALDRSREVMVQSKRKTSARSRIGNLSARKRQVLQGLLAGMSNKMIAQRLALSPRTIELYRATMMEELEVGSLAEALHMAIDAELTPLSEGFAADAAGGESEDTGEHSNGQVGAPAIGTIAAPALPPARDILEGTTDCVFLVDREWRFTYLNANARQLMAGGEDLAGASLWEMFPLTAGTRAWDELHKAAADGRPARFEFYEPHLRSWLDTSVRPYSAGLQVCFRNVSRERYSSAQLRLSEETLLHALEAAGDGAWDWNIQTGEVAMSPGFLARLGYAPDAFPTDFDSFVHLVHSDDLPLLTRCLKEHLDGCSNSFRCEYRLRCADGGWLWNLDRGRVVTRDAITGLPLRMVGTASDITDIKAAQQTAEEAFKRLELAQGNAGVGLWDLDLESRIVRFCHRSREMHGLGPDGPLELTREAWASTVHEADREQVEAKLKLYIDCGETYRIRYRTIDAQGTVRWVLGMGKAVFGHDGRPERFVGLNLEVTALRALIDDADDDNVTIHPSGDVLPRGN
jgi:PAS domain S-box-containing protein